MAVPARGGGTAGRPTSLTPSAVRSVRVYDSEPGSHWIAVGGLQLKTASHSWTLVRRPSPVIVRVLSYVKKYCLSRGALPEPSGPYTLSESRRSPERTR